MSDKRGLILMVLLIGTLTIALAYNPDRLEMIDNSSLESEDNSSLDVMPDNTGIVDPTANAIFPQSLSKNAVNESQSESEGAKLNLPEAIGPSTGQGPDQNAIAYGRVYSLRIENSNNTSADPRAPDIAVFNLCDPASSLSANTPTFQFFVEDDDLASVAWLEMLKEAYLLDKIVVCAYVPYKDHDHNLNRVVWIGYDRATAIRVEMGEL